MNGNLGIVIASLLCGTVVFAIVAMLVFTRRRRKQPDADVTLLKAPTTLKSSAGRDVSYSYAMQVPPENCCNSPPQTNITEKAEVQTPMDMGDLKQGQDNGKDISAEPNVSNRQAGTTKSAKRDNAIAEGDGSGSRLKQDPKSSPDSRSQEYSETGSSEESQSHDTQAVSGLRAIRSPSEKLVQTDHVQILEQEEVSTPGQQSPLPPGPKDQQQTVVRKPVIVGNRLAVGNTLLAGVKHRGSGSVYQTVSQRGAPIVVEVEKEGQGNKVDKQPAPLDKSADHTSRSTSVESRNRVKPGSHMVE